MDLFVSDSESNDSFYQNSQLNEEAINQEQDILADKEEAISRQAVKLPQELSISNQDALNIKNVQPQKEQLNQNKEHSLNVQQKVFQKSDEEKQKLKDYGSFETESQCPDQILEASLTPFEKDLLELNSQLNLELINEYLVRGNVTVQNVKGKNVVILLGTTGAGKTTSILYLIGYKMQEEDFLVEEIDQRGNKSVVKKKVIGSVEKVENAKIGNTNVSETQFLNVFDIEFNDQDYYITDSPGFKDKRRLEIDLTNNLNIMNMLKVCKSIRFVFLVNYFELKASKGAPFIETALIAAKMLNGSNFEKNLESVCIFYSHAQGIEIKAIKTEIVSIKKAIPSLNTISNSDRDLLKIFLSYLIDQINDDDSLIFNPLDKNNRPNVLEKIFSKPGMEKPAQKVSSVSFSSESESRIKLYCNLAKDKIEQYASQYKFKEVSELLTLLQEMFEKIKFENLETLIKNQQAKIARDFKQKLENQIQLVVENLKKGNRFLQYSLDDLTKTKKQLVEWEQQKYPHFMDCDVDSNFFISSIIEKFKQYMNQAEKDNQNFENLIKITESLDQLHEVFGEESAQMKEVMREKIKLLMDTETKQAFLEINEKLQGKQLINNSQYFQFVLSVLDIISQLNQKEELAVKCGLIETPVVKKSIIQNIFDALDRKEKELLSYFEEVKKGLDEYQAQQAILNLSSKLNDYTPSFYLIIAFSSCLSFSELCPEICQIQNNIRKTCKEVLCIYFAALNNELKFKKLKSKYLLEYLMRFLNQFKTNFYLDDQEIEDSYRNYHAQLEQIIKEKEEKIKNIVKIMTQGKDLTQSSILVQSDTQNLDYSSLQHNPLNQKDPYESITKSLEVLESIKWMDLYFDSKSISHRIEYCIKKLQKFSMNQIQFVENIAEQMLLENEIDEKRRLYQSLQQQYLSLRGIRRNFEQFLPKTKGRFQEIFDSLTKQFQDYSVKFSNQIKLLQNTDNLSKHFLFDLETSLMVIKYIPKDLLSNEGMSSEELVEKFDQNLKKKIHQIPLQDQWESLLNQNDSIFKKWAMLLEEIDILRQNKSSLILLLEKSTLSQQIFDDKFVSNKIKALHNHLKRIMNEFLESKDFQKADQICKTLNSMSADLSEYFQFDHIYEMGQEIRKEVKSLLSDIEKQNNLKSIKERFAHLKEIPSNQKDCALIQQGLQEQYDKQLKILMKETNNVRIIDQDPSQKIENLFEMKIALEDILEKGKLEEKFNQNFLKPFQQLSNGVMKSSFLSYLKNGKDQELLDLFNWYKKILDCLTLYSVDIKNMANLEELLIQSLNEEIKKVTQKDISTWSKGVFSDFLLLAQQIVSKKNLFFSNLNLQNKLSEQQNQLKNYLDKQLKDCKEKFKEYLSKSPVNINEAKKVILIIQKLEEIYQQCYHDTQVTEDIQDLEMELQTKEYAQIQVISEYLDSFVDDDQPKVQQVINMINETIQKDKIGFLKIKELFIKKNEESCSRLSNILSQEKIQFCSILPILKQLLKLTKLKQNINFQDGSTVLQTDQLIKQLLTQLNFYQMNLEDTLSNTNNLISQNELKNFFDLQVCVQKLKAFSKVDQQEIVNLQKLTTRLKNKIYESVRESINQFNLSYANSNYKGLLKSLLSLKKVDGIIQYIKMLQQSESEIPEFCDQRLWEIVESSNIQSYSIAQGQAQKLIEQVEQDLKQSWEKNNFKSFAQYMKNLKQLHDDDPQNKLMSKTYKELKENYENDIVNQYKTIYDYIRKEEWGEKLSKKVDIQQDQVKDLHDTDLSEPAIVGSQITQESLKDKLNEKLKEFKEENQIESKCKLLIDMRKICDLVPNFEVPVKKKITECINTLVANSADGQKEIFALSNILNTKNEPMAELILKEATHFSSINVKNFKEKISGQHNPDYINLNLKKLCFKTKEISNLDEIFQTNLKTKYNQFQEKFQQTVDQYLKKISQIGNLADEIVQYATKKSSISLDFWNQKSIEDCNYLLSQVCAFWTLSSFKKDSVQDEGQMVYKELHASQIYSIMVLLGFECSSTSQKLENQLIQILTGEGKSIVLGILSTLLALLNYNVDVVCYSRHLSDRDFQDFESFFESLKIKEKIKYGTFTDICDDKINQQGDIRKLSQELLKGSLGNQTTPPKQKSVLLIDEVDVFFSDSFYGQTYNPSCSWKSKEIMNIMKKIWQEKGLKKETILNLIFKEADFLSLIQKFPKLERLLKVHIKSMIDAVINIKDHKYIFQDCKIGYQQHDSISFTTVYGYSTNFAYFQEMERGNLTEEQVEAVCGINLQCGHFSYCLLPLLYSKILGVTGTLETLNQEYLNIVGQYTQKATLIPSMFGTSKLDEDRSTFIITFDEENYFLSIMNQAKKYLDKGQPVLIFFKDNSILDKFLSSTYVNQYKDKLQVLNQQTRHIKTAVDKACRYGQLTLCERAFGRGTDFYCSNIEVNNLGGAVVIQTFFSEEISEEFQVKGRTARQSNEGKFFIVLYANDVQESLHIKIEELKQKSHSKSELYLDLDSKRKLLYAEKVKLLSQSAIEAKLLHDETITYSDFLKQNKVEDALALLIKFNSGKSNQSQQLIHFLLLLDDSGSMSAGDGTNKSRWQRLIEAIHTFIQERSGQSFSDDDIASIIYHSSNSISVAKYEKLSNLSSILNINPPRYSGNSFYLAIDLAIQILDNEPNQYKSMKKVIMFLSDGGDCDSQVRRTQSLNNLKAKYKQQILGFWSIGFGPGAEAGALQDMTNIMKECGGEYKTAMNLVELQKNFTDLACIESVMTMK